MLPEVSGHSGTAEGASVELCSASKNGAPPPALRPQLCPGTRMAPGSGSLRLAAEQARTDPDWLSFPHPGATESRDPRGVSTRRMRGGHGGGTRARRRLGDDTHQRYVATTHRVRAVLHALCRQSAATRLPNRQQLATCPLNPYPASAFVKHRLRNLTESITHRLRFPAIWSLRSSSRLLTSSSAD